MTLGLDRASFNQGKNAKFDFSILEEMQPTLTAKGPGAIGGGTDMDEYIVRRLTPLECERLQGYPDGWTDIGDWVDSKGKTHNGDSDSPRYKALGNSIATGPDSYWEFIIKRISAQYDRRATMASLFDGIGGFPLEWDRFNGDGATLWASEIEEFPIAVTKIHFPKMQHLGDITKINGAEAPVVDCICGGSPCQDLSVAGLRKGLSGERSGLFMEQIRIIKEMRENDRINGRTDELIRPRYGIWENVAGALSSNKGEDFRCVLEEFCKIGDRSINVPSAPNGKWTKSGAIMGDGFSVAWTLHDAKDWCVPQRRQRISVVCDFAGDTAAEILFKRKSLSGHSQQGREEREDSPRDTEDGTGDDH